jgi:hypothetical protein
MPPRPIVVFDQLGIDSYVGGSEGFQLFDEFIGGTTAMVLGWSQGVLGAGAAVAIDSTLVSASSPGVISLSTGTTVTGRAVQFLGTTPIFLPNGELQLEWRVRLPILPTALEQFFVNIGLQDNPNTSTDGGATSNLGFRVPISTVSANWQAIARRAGVLTTVTTTVPVVANAWVKLRVEFSSTGGAKFFVNGVQVATMTPAQLPIAGMASMIKIVKSIGVTSRQVFADYALTHVKLATAR